MEDGIFIYFIGTAGSGKSTLTSTYKKWTDLRDLDAITVNLDPGAENLPYQPEVDIRDWISLKEIMDSYNLGPNGAQIACADMVALNSEDIKKSIESFKPEYILMDTPGQLELFVFRESGKHIINFMNPSRTMVAYLLDYALAKNPSGFVSQLMLSLSTNFRLAMPQINILSKSDLLTDEEKKRIIKWSENAEYLYSSLSEEKASLYREMSENMLNIIENFQSHNVLVPTGKENFFGIEDLYTAIQLQFEGGEDFSSD